MLYETMSLASTIENAFPSPPQLANTPQKQPDDDSRWTHRRWRRSFWKSIRPPAGPVVARRIHSRDARGGYSRVTYELEKQGDAVKLTLIQEIEKTGSRVIEAMSNGWPLILASLKSLLETGESLEETRRWPEGL